MRKKVFGRKLSRDRGSRTALFRSLIKALVKHGKIITTKAKAKAIQSDVDKLITLAKSKEITKIRQVSAYLANERESTEKLFGKIAQAFAEKQSGFTRLVNLPRRRGDNAEIVRIEWTEQVITAEKGKKEKGKEKPADEKTDKAEKTETKKTDLRSRVQKLIKSGKK